MTLWRMLVLIGSAVLLAACSDDGGADSTDAAASDEAASAMTADDVAGGEGVTVLGDGQVSVRPDTAVVVVGVEVQRPDVQSAFADANAAAEAVLEALRAEGLGDEDLRTEDLSVREQRDRPPEGTPSVIGYVVTNSVRAVVDDVDSVGRVIGAAVEAGGDAARVHRIQFVVEDDDAALEEARQRAFADAERRAQHYAELAGRDLGELTSLSEVISPGDPRPVPEATDQVSAAPVEAGRQDVHVQIRATWALE